MEVEKLYHRSSKWKNPTKIGDKSLSKTNKTNETVYFSLVHPFLGRVGENPLMSQDEWMFPFSVKHQLWVTTKMSVNDSTEGNKLRSKPWPDIYE